MLGKYSVKKPYTVIVGIILVLALGVISFSNMTTDLLPSMNFPYVIVYTTYVGATPEEVESEITRPMEAAFATLTDVKEITSTSSDNLSFVMMEFNDSADMNTALVEINSEITTLSASWSDSVGSPVIMKINPDMLPVSIVSVARDDMDIYELSEYVEDTLVPEYEALNGVASVTAMGTITQEVDITIEQDRIDVLNNAILNDINAELAEVEQELDDAQTLISDGRSQLSRQKSAIMTQLDSAIAQLEDSETLIASAIEQLQAQRDELEDQLEEVNDAVTLLEAMVNLSDEDKQTLLELEQELGELLGQKDFLEEQLEALENGEGNQALEEERASAVESRESLIAERDAMLSYIEDLENADEASLQSAIESLNSQIETAQSELAGAQSDLASATADLNETQDLIDELNEAIAALQDSSDGTSAASEDSDDTAATDPPAVTDESAAQASLSDPQPTVEPDERLMSMSIAYAEEDDLETLQAKLAEAEALLTEQQAAVDAAQATVDEKSAALASLQEELAEKEDALEDVQSGSLQSRIDAAEAEVSRLESRISILDAEIEAIDELLSGDSTAIGTIRSALASLDEAIEEIESSEVYQALQLLEDEDSLNEQYAAAVSGQAQLNAAIASIDEMLEKLENGIIPGGLIDGITEDTSVSDALEQLEDARAEALAAFAEAEAALDEASEELAEARKEFEDARDEALAEAGLDGVITVETVTAILAAQNISMPAGYVYDLSDEEYLVRVGDEYTSIDELKSTKLFSLGLDSVDEVRLTDVASVEITDDSDDVFTKVDGQDGIMLSIEKQSTFSTTEVAELVAEKNEEMTEENEGMLIVDLFNQGDYINLIVNSVLQNLLQGFALAMIVLMLFLMDWRPTIIVGLSIPLSVVAAFVCMYFSGITLNVLSLSGLSLGIGMLVDNSIVAIENIYRLHNEKNYPILTACVEGVKQVSGSLIASTITTICIFLPIVFIDGIARDLLTDLALTMAFSLLASLLIAMTVVPMGASFLMKKRTKRENGLFTRFQRGYTKVLNGALKIKPVVLIAALALFAFTVMQVSDMGTSFMPEVSSDQMTATLTLDPEEDTSAQQDEAVELMMRILDVDGISAVGLTGGSSISSLMGGSSDSLTYYIILDEDIDRENEDVAADIAAEAEDMNLEVSVSTSTMDISMLAGDGISVDIAGEDLDTLRGIAADVAEIVSTVDGAIEIDDGLDDAEPEIRITVDKELAIDNNLTVAQVYQFIAEKLYGKMEITEATLDGTTMSIYLIDGRNSSITPDTLEDLEIEVTSGDLSEMVRIGDIAAIEEAEGFNTISRANQQRTVSVSFSVADGYSSNHVSDNLEALLADYELPEDYTITLSGENETVSEIMEDLMFMIIVAVLLIFLIMVAEFQSFKSPIIVMFTIPLAFTGGLLALLITGMDLSIVAVIGFLVLSGVIVNNGIVFVDTVNQLRVGGMSKHDALIEAGRQRLRPILMTAMTTILGMFTMALGMGTGAEMMQPMAVVTIGGLAYATLMTLFVVPCFYDLINGEKMSAREIKMAREAAGMEAGELGSEDNSEEKMTRREKKQARKAAKQEKKQAKDAPKDENPSGEAPADDIPPENESPKQDASAPEVSAEPASEPESPAQENPSGQDTPEDPTPAQDVSAEPAPEDPTPAQDAPAQAPRTPKHTAEAQASRQTQPAEPQAPAQPTRSASDANQAQQGVPPQGYYPGYGYGYGQNPYYPPYYPPYPYGQPMNQGYPQQGYPNQDPNAQGNPQQNYNPRQGYPQYPPYPQYPQYPQYPYGYPYGAPQDLNQNPNPEQK